MSSDIPDVKVKSSDWSLANLNFLFLITTGYIIGEISHFLIGVTSKEVANSVPYGDQICEPRNSSIEFPCDKIEEEAPCLTQNDTCQWVYNGQGTQFQLLVGPAFIYTFATAALMFGLLLDRFNRPLLTGIGIILFSVCCVVMGFAQDFWQLVVLRVGIALGEAVCRPAASSLIAERFSAENRGVANGIFSWGIYFGYGLAYIYGKYLSEADILGQGWRASYVIGGGPGIVIGVLILLILRETRNTGDVKEEDEGRQTAGDKFKDLLRDLWTAFRQPTLILLVISASVRQIAGLAWANNNVNYFTEYYPDKDIAYYWLTVCSVFAGGFGVVSGGWITDRLQKRFGLHSRLWVQSAFLTLATPFAVLTIYLEPPYCFIALALYYLFAETWFAILFTVIVEIVPANTRGVCTAFFLFVMNVIAGTLGILVEQVGDAIGFRNAMYLFFPGLIALDAVLFFITSLPLYFKSRNVSTAQ